VRALSVSLTLTIAAMAMPVHAHLGNGNLDYPYSLKDIREGAQLRAEAIIVIPIVFHPCGKSAALDPVLDRYAAFLEGLTQTRQKIDMDIALADYDYQMSLVDINCPSEDAPDTLERETLDILVANGVLDRMDRLVEKPSGQDK